MTTKNIYFIDARVADYQTLIASLPTDSQWFVLDAAQDGIAQMQTILVNYSNLDSIQILSHGSQGTLFLGSTVLNNSNINSYSSKLGSIGNSLTSTGDLLLYGCNVAQENVGQSFINALSQYTGADVAASIDLTGANVLGGNWLLESAVGAIEVTAINASQFSGVLAVNTVPTFTVGDGKVTTDFGANSKDYCRSLTVQADGKILLGGSTNDNVDFALVRYNTDGSLDTSFDGDGKVTTDIGTYSDYGQSVTVQADGKILLGGFSGVNGHWVFAILRYNADGSLDTSFDGDGKVTTDFGTNFDYGYSVTVQADGKILVGGVNYFSGNADFALVRYNTDGSLDTSFDGDGKVTTIISIYRDLGYRVIVQADGKILMGGSTGLSNNTDFALVRYNTDGSLDTSFDGDGIVTTDIGVGGVDSGQSVTVQADGKILLGGVSNSAFALVRYNTDGSLDTSFDGDGKVTTDFGGGQSVTVQADGKILLGGSSYSDFALVRYNTDGSLDTSFDGDGKVTTDVGGLDYGQSVTVQADGKILLGGVSVLITIQLAATTMTTSP